MRVPFPCPDIRTAVGLRTRRLPRGWPESARATGPYLAEQLGFGRRELSVIEHARSVQLGQVGQGRDAGRRGASCDDTMASAGGYHRVDDLSHSRDRRTRCRALRARPLRAHQRLAAPLPAILAGQGHRRGHHLVGRDGAGGDGLRGAGRGSCRRRAGDRHGRSDRLRHPGHEPPCQGHHQLDDGGDVRVCGRARSRWRHRHVPRHDRDAGHHRRSVPDRRGHLQAGIPRGVPGQAGHHRFHRRPGHHHRGRPATQALRRARY